MPFGVKKQKSTLAAYSIANIFPHKMNTVMILSFQTDMPGQTVQTQIRLLLDQIFWVSEYLGNLR